MRLAERSGEVETMLKEIRAFGGASRPILYTIAAVFGLTPELVIRRLQQQVDKYKDDLQSTQSSTSVEDLPTTSGGSRASVRPRPT